MEYTPDLSLCKYEVLGDNDANGLIGRHNAFLRQWNRITSLTKTRIHLLIQYHANNQPGERMKFLLLITSSSDAVLPALHQLVRVSPLADYFHFVPVDWNSLEHQLAWSYCSEAVLKKTERRRNSDMTSEANSQNFFVVSGWKSAEDASLIVFSPSSGSRFPLAINPFQFPIGMALAEHIQNLDEVFEGAFPLSPPLPALLDRAIEAVYVDHGWDVEDINTGERDYPTMTELYKKLEEELEKTDYDGEVRGNMKSALEMRISSLLWRVPGGNRRIEAGL